MALKILFIFWSQLCLEEQAITNMYVIVKIGKGRETS